MLPETLRHYWSGDVLAANVMHACKVDVRMACWVRMFWPPNNGDSESYAALLRASRFGGHLT